MSPKRKSLLLAAHTISKRSSLETKLKSPTLGLCYWLCPVGEPIWRVASCHLALHKHKNMRFIFFLPLLSFRAIYLLSAIKMRERKSIMEVYKSHMLKNYFSWLWEPNSKHFWFFKGRKSTSKLLAKQCLSMFLNNIENCSCIRFWSQTTALSI